MKIEKLTPEQEARIPALRDEWLHHGLSTEPANFDAVEQAVKEAYAIAGLEPPKIFIRLASPNEGAIGAAILKNTRLGDQVGAQIGSQVRDQVRAQIGSQARDQVRAQIWAQIGAQVWDQVRAQVWAQVRAQVRAQIWAQIGSQVWDQVRDQVGDQVRAQVWDQVRAQIGSQVWDQVRDQVGDQVRAQVWDQVRAQVGAQVGAQVWDQVRAQVGSQVRDQVRDQVGDQVRAQVWAQVSSAFYSQHEAGWLSWLAFFRRIIDLPNTEKIEPLLRIAQSCGWVWFFAGAVIITDRPRTLKRDEQNRLHCEAGPALEYRDGFAIYSWHGTRVPAHWINDRANLDPNEVIKASNVEQRAVGAAIVGWPKMLTVLKAKTVDKHANPDIGELIELTLPGLPEPGRFLKAMCPRNGIIVEGVPRTSDIDGLPINTALAAQAWRIGDPQSEYIHPERRT